jgi:FkbM family methyltransferase
VLTRAYGMARSLAMYHGIPGRHRRMVAFYREFLGPGDLAFDVGAHVGSRVRAWRKLGGAGGGRGAPARLRRVLRLLFGRDAEVVIVTDALGAEPGTAQLGVSTATPTVSSMAAGWRDDVAHDASFARVRWDRTVDVAVTTLDALVAEHGEPAFCKVDVEGFELDVLAGLSKPVRALSFEYLPPAHDAALAVLARVEELGDYRYNYSPVETLTWASPSGSTRTACGPCWTATARWAARATCTRGPGRTRAPAGRSPGRR